MNTNWIKITDGIYRLKDDAKDYAISYNDGTERSPVDELLCLVGSLGVPGGIKPENKSRPETAIVLPDDTKPSGRRFLILYGDHRNDYEKLYELGLEACLDYFNNHMHQITDTSDLPLGIINH